jgi:hypothetical protein
MNSIADIRMSDLISNFTRISKDYSDKYNELINMESGIGEEGFLDEFRKLSDDLVKSVVPFIEILDDLKEHITQNILGRHSLA